MEKKAKRILFYTVVAILAIITIFAIIFAIVALAGKTTTGFIGFFGTVIGIMLFGFLPAVILFILVFYYFFFGLAKAKTTKEVVYVDATPPADPNAKVITPRSGNKEPNPRATLEYWLMQVEQLKLKPRITPKMALGPAHKLEKFKNQAKYRDDVEAQKLIRADLNWCYEQIGSVQYDLDKVEKNINKRQEKQAATDAGNN